MRPPHPLHERVEVDDVYVAGAALVRAAGDPQDERRSFGRRLHGHDLVGLDVGPEPDDQLGIAVEQVLVHRSGRYSVGSVEDADLELRRRTYAFFVEHGRAPRAAELGDPREVVAGWRRLHAEHALVLNAATDELRMLNPFSVVPTAYRVQAGGRWWYGNCAWDALGIPAALHKTARVESRCEATLEPFHLEIGPDGPESSDWLFHCAVPAAKWWDDIAFT